MVNFIIAAILLAIVGTAVCYVVKAKKSGAKCIGCPVDGGCSSNPGNGSGCGCGCESNTTSCSCCTDTN